MSINQNVDLTTYLNMEHPVKRTAAVSAADKSSTADKSDSKTTAKKTEDGFSFRDLIDIVNPLQHIPVVSTIYRELTGDKINNAARIVGGALYGGVIGAVVGGVNAIAVAETGKDVGELAIAKMGIGHSQTDDPAAQVKTASTSQPVAPVVSKSPSASPVPSGAGGSSPTENIPVIEVHPQAKAQTSAGFDTALDSPKETAAKTDAAKPDTHPLSSALQAQQFRHFTTHDVHVSKMDADRAGLGLPQKKPVEDLKPVDNNSAETASAGQPAPIEVQQVPEEMMNAWVKYQQMKQASNGKSGLSDAMTAGDETATN